MSVWGTPLILNPPDLLPDCSNIVIEQGNIASSNGQNSTTSQASRLRTSGYIPIKSTRSYVITCNIARVYIYLYNSSQALAGSSGGWLTVPAIIDIDPSIEAKYMRVVISKTSGNITPSEVTSFIVSEIIFGQRALT